MSAVTKSRPRKPRAKRPAPGNTVAYRQYLRELERTGNTAALRRELKRVKLSDRALAAIIAKSPPMNQWRD